MSKPVLINNPVTGQQHYTRHPERVMKRIAQLQASKTQTELVDDRTYWQGSYKGPKLHPPGIVRS
jgi:hypothetical protein